MASVMRQVHFFFVLTVACLDLALHHDRPHQPLAGCAELEGGNWVKVGQVGKEVILVFAKGVR
jgi:hypothetical protein